jgi:hypothetical protein
MRRRLGGVLVGERGEVLRQRRICRGRAFGDEALDLEAIDDP